MAANTIRAAAAYAQVSQISAPGDVRVAAAFVQISEVAQAPGTIRVAAAFVQVSEVAVSGAPLRVASASVQVSRETPEGPPQAPSVKLVQVGSAWGIFELSELASFDGDEMVGFNYQVDWHDTWGEFPEEWQPAQPSGFQVGRLDVDNNPRWFLVQDTVFNDLYSLFMGFPRPDGPSVTPPNGGRFRLRAQVEGLGGLSEWGPYIEFEVWRSTRTPSAPELTLEAAVDTNALVGCTAMESVWDPIVTANEHQNAEEGSAAAESVYRLAILWEYYRFVDSLIQRRWFLQQDVGEHPDAPPSQSFELVADFEYTAIARWITGPDLHQVLDPLPSWWPHLLTPPDPMPPVENRHMVLGAESEPLTINADPPPDPCEEFEEEENVSFTVECDPVARSLTVILGAVACGTTDQVWWRVGTAKANGEFGGSQNWIATNANRLTRIFDLVDAGIRFAVGWRRHIIGKGWQDGATFFTPAVTCLITDNVPTPFFVNPPGHPYSENFTLSWDFRGLSEDFALPDRLVYRIEHSIDLGESYQELEAAHPDMSFLVDFVEDLIVGDYQKIRVTAIDAITGVESSPAVFIFRRKSLANFHIRDFKSDPGESEDASEFWTGAGTGSDRMEWVHEVGMGYKARMLAASPFDDSSAVIVFTDIGTTPLGHRGVVCQSERVQNESLHSIANRFKSVLFMRHGLALAVNGTGSKTNWSGLLLNRKSDWSQGWGWSGNARAPGHSGGAAGSNAEFNRINFGNVEPFVYGIISNLQGQARVKRTGLTTAPLILGSATATAASRWFPTNRVSGQMTYTIPWELVKVPGGWSLRYMILGPGIDTGWLVEDLLVADTVAGAGGATHLLPAGYVGLSSANPTPGGDAIFHSLVVEEIVEMAEIISTCPLPPALLNVPYSYQLQLDGELPEGWTWQVISGGLPTGLELDPDSGLISGTPTEDGVWEFCIAITDGVEESGSFCCELEVGASLAGCAKDFMVLGSRVGSVSEGKIYMPDALSSFTGELSKETGTILAVRTKVYAAEGTDGEADFRRLYVTGYARGFVGMWVMPFFDGRPYQQLRRWLSAPAPQSNRTERFHLWMELSQLRTFIEAEGPQTEGIRASTWAVHIETTDPEDQYHIETVTLLHSPINDARIIRTSELQLQEHL